MTPSKILSLFAASVALVLPIATKAETSWWADVKAIGSTGAFAPYYFMANSHGTVTSGRALSTTVGVQRPLDLNRRFSWSYVVEGYATAGNRIDYTLWDYDTQSWVKTPLSTSGAWIKQACATLKYRALYYSAGIQDFRPWLVNPRLSSGGVIESGNARALPGVRGGFVDFRSIPFTNDWVQVSGELAYAKSTDNKWSDSHYNHYDYHINQGWWYNYKRWFFRTKPSMPLSLTIGLEAAAQFSGYTYYYGKIPGRDGKTYYGKIIRTEGNDIKLHEFMDMIILKEGDGYWKGNHVGAWDIEFRYRLPNKSEIKAYCQWLWEDGSGIGKLNGYDGLWGLEWKPAKQDGLVSGAVLEFLTFMNQSGPFHYDYDDNQGTDLRADRASGNDAYYNNSWFNGFAIYGQAIGSPMFLSPLYNTDGSVTRFLQNRFWGFHGAVEGHITPTIDYRLMANYRAYEGSLARPNIDIQHSVSGLIEASWSPTKVKGLTLNAQCAFDCGSSELLHRNVGLLLSARYTGLLSSSK